MAQRVHIVLEDDMDGTTADETVTFGLDGVTYDIDLSSENAAALRNSLAGYVGAARRTTGRAGSRRSSSRSRGSGPTPAEVRDWARGEGYEVSDRGRVPAGVREAFDNAH